VLLRLVQDPELYTARSHQPSSVKEKAARPVTGPRRRLRFQNNTDASKCIPIFYTCFFVSCGRDLYTAPSQSHRPVLQFLHASVKGRTARHLVP
jgi:hypothetical protein